jgi:hypothetical protein
VVKALTTEALEQLEDLLVAQVLATQQIRLEHLGKVVQVVREVVMLVVVVVVKVPTALMELQEMEELVVMV